MGTSIQIYKSGVQGKDPDCRDKEVVSVYLKLKLDEITKGMCLDRKKKSSQD